MGHAEAGDTVSMIHTTHAVSCNECGFTTKDLYLMAGHSCDVQEHGGFCEDYPCCGHEMNDCNGQLYGSDEAIKARVYEQMDDPDWDPYYDEGFN